MTIPAPADGVLASFAPDNPFSVAGGHLLAYPVGSDSAPSFDTAEGSLHVTVDQPRTAVPQYLGVLLVSDGHCIDASEFSGVRFSLSGTVSGCTLQYFAGDDIHQDETSGAPHAVGPAGSYQPRVSLPLEQLSTSPRTVSLRFAEQSGGSPNIPVDLSRLILVAWELTVDPATGDLPASCLVDIRIDDVTLYRAATQDKSAAGTGRATGATVTCGSSSCTDTQTCCLDAYAGTETCLDGHAFCGTPASTGIPVECDEQTDCLPGQTCCYRSMGGYVSIACVPEEECPGDFPSIINRVLCASPAWQRACEADETCVPLGGAAPPVWAYCSR